MPHPIQAIESFNETVRENEIGLYPCAFCHNYKDEYIDQIRHPKYNPAIELAPLFLKKEQAIKLFSTLKSERAMVRAMVIHNMRIMLKRR